MEAAASDSYFDAIFAVGLVLWAVLLGVFYLVFYAVLSGVARFVVKRHSLSRDRRLGRPISRRCTSRSTPCAFQTFELLRATSFSGNVTLVARCFGEQSEAQMTRELSVENDVAAGKKFRESYLMLPYGVLLG